MKLPEATPDLKKISAEKHLLISEYFNDKEVGAFIEKANAEYWYWSDVKYHAPPNKDREVLWLLVKNSRGWGARRIKLGGFEFKYLIRDSMLKKLHEMDMSVGGALETSGIIPAEDGSRFLVSSLMEESIASSQLEGAATTRKVAKEMLRSERKPSNKSEQMILNNYRTIKQIAEIKDKPINATFLLGLHRTITEDTLENAEEGGRFRQTDDIFVQDRIDGTVLHTPPASERIPELVGEICAFANKEDEEWIHPIVKAIILHFLVGYVHPFTDGNGRAARAVFYWYLLSKGYWLLEYVSISRVIVKKPVQYARAYLYTEQDDNDLTYFINYNLDVVDTALQELKNYVAEKRKEKESLYKFLSLGNINRRQAILLNQFSQDAKKTTSIKEAMNTFGVVYQTARSDLLLLENMGFLKKKTVGRKKLLFMRADSFEKRLKESKEVVGS